MLNTIYHGDCMEILPSIPDASVDMVLCDLPYGTTACKWDSIIDMSELWVQYKRIVKPNGAILLFSDEPFTSLLVCSNLKMFKQRITWDKDRGSGFVTAHKRLMKQTEDICLFSLKSYTYNPQMVKANQDRIRPATKKLLGQCNVYTMSTEIKRDDKYDPTLRYPTNLIKLSSMSKECNNLSRVHPTQKPVALCEYLIKTYTQLDEVVLDNCIGSGTTAVACINTGRQYIGIEKDEKYVSIALERVRKARGAYTQHVIDGMAV